MISKLLRRGLAYLLPTEGGLVLHRILLLDKSLLQHLCALLIKGKDFGRGLGLDLGLSLSLVVVLC